MDKREIINLIEEHKLIAIIRGVSEEDLSNTVQALIDGGVRFLEITFDHNDIFCIESTTKKIKMIVEQFGERVCVGAGTVLTVEEVKEAVKAGARYIISPNVDIEVIKKTNELDAISIPGALTPTEAVFAYNAGADFVKLFPAGEIGKSYIKAFMSPLAHIPFLAVGGVNPENVSELLGIGVRGVGVGGHLVNLNAIKGKKFSYITETAKKFTINIGNNKEDVK